MVKSNSAIYTLVGGYSCQTLFWCDRGCGIDTTAIQPNSDNGSRAEYSTSNDTTNRPVDDTGTPSSTTSYEDAYIHGYKEGYATGYGKSHIELKHQPIAIIGMSCRLPGSVSTPDEFWELLARSRTGFTSIPPSRFSANRFFHPNPGKSGTTNARGGNFLTHDLTAFDAPFFGFTQQEAISLDPQQRLLLECTFEALESAGVLKHDVVGKDVGVFVGGTFSEYEADLFRDPETIPMHQATAAGVHLNMLPEFWISYSMSRLFGEAGRSFAFDQRGTGYGRGEGCGMILLKPLDQAIRDNDPIRAVIAGSGINQDGKTPGITMPNGSAQGIAGVIKTALMLERGFILPNYDFKQPNEKIPFDEWGLKVPIRQQPWPFGKRWASVNGFGFGGTNAHVVMTRGPLERKTMKEEVDTQTSERLFVISANDKISTEKAMQNVGIYLERRPEVFQNDLLSNLAYTLGQRKSLHPWRIAISASSSVDLVEALCGGKVTPAKQELDELRFGWADAHLRSIGATFSLLEELEKDEQSTLVNAATISQPSCTAVQLALVDLMRSWGISPSAVVGHSSGEIGAAYAAGLITFDDAMTIAYHRGRLIPILKKKFPNLDGCMMAVGAGRAEIAPLLDRISPSLGEARIACINSPSSVTVSGDADAIKELQTLIEEAHPGMFARTLQSSSVRFHSSLLGRLASGIELDSTYWVQNLTCAVRFDEAVQSMCQPADDFKTGVNFLVELGPHAALQGPIKQILKHVGGPATKIAYSSALGRKKNAVQTALALAGTLFVKGVALNMGAINFPTPLDRPSQVLTDLPRYPWNHSTTFYHESRLTKIHKFHDAPRNDIIGVLAPYSNDFEPTWRNVVRLDDLPWLRHYQMQGITIFPISGFVVMALEAIVQRAQTQNVNFDVLEVKDLAVRAPAMLTEEDLEMTITLRPSSESFERGLSNEFHIRSWSKSKGWTEHCTGIVSAASADRNEVDGVRAQQIKERKIHSRSSKLSEAAIEPVATQAMYEQLSEIGVSYGATFQGLQSCHASSNASAAQITVAHTVAEMPQRQETDYILHPSFLEQLISMYWPILGATGPPKTVHLPSSIGKVTVSAKVCEYLQSPGCSLQAFCHAMISVEDLSISPILEMSAGTEVEGPRELCYKLEWEPISEAGTNGVKSPQFSAEVVIIHDQTDEQAELAFALSDHLKRLSGIQSTMSTLSSAVPLARDKLCIFLAELNRPVLANLSAAEFEALQCLITSVQGVLWVVRGAYVNPKNPDANMVTGLSRAIRSEGTLMKFVTLDLDAGKDYDHTDIAQTILHTFIRALAASSNMEETEFMERDGKLLTPRIVHDTTMNEYVNNRVHPSATESARFSDIERPLKGASTTPGAFDYLIFEDDESLHSPLPEDHVEFQVKAIGISPKAGTADSAIGTECSGIITAVGSAIAHLKVGDRVAAIEPNGSLSTMARAHSRFLFKFPDHISFEAAATMPIAYCTASYALMEQARLLESETILIHDAASAVGQAALAIAQMIGAEAWVTVQNAEEKDLFMRECGISSDRIWFVGSEAFAESLRDATSGRGVDVVFNTLTDAHMLSATWRCLSIFGRFVKIDSAHGMLGNMPLEMNATLLSADVLALAMHRPQVLQRTLADVAGLLRYGRIHPIRQVKVFGISELAAALQNVQGAGIHGKVVIVPCDDELVLAPRLEKHDMLFRPDGTYILIGGTGGLGRSMAKWMVGKGAKNIVLVSRSGAMKGKAQEQIAALNDTGANIVVRRCDVADRSDVDSLISSGLADLPPVRGIIHGAMVLHVSLPPHSLNRFVLTSRQDVLFEKMTYEQYTTVIASKVQGAWNFHHALSTARTPLDFFVVISSAAGAVGNRGQAAYAAANTFLNGFAQHLLGQGISAASIDLTAVSDAGYLAEDAEKAAEVARNLGSDTICEAEVLALIQAAVEGKLASCNGHPITGMRITPTMRPFWSNDAKFVHLLRAAEAASASSATATTISWSAAFKAAPSRLDAEQIVCDALVEKIAEVIAMEPKELDISRALSHYPLDSLTAIEVRNFITRMFEANLQVLELLASGSIETLAKVVCTKSKAALPAA
ncbi:uncharacterized protein K460DRAFT_372604 [Cucurbitaria berberidis CBS 394.84]|uniref:Polyketide synthase n=1 Tax=Cucurbitaria berberidis CBS 394.84 TaxID=1168544 RepID=A0A9P4GS63_9PLEO|nr:uncharacterized protein K460DRAFT_372604 [Cucurbitaria berberidis CBS 394.84]KAF1850314.1 hypothetical protein K460DRAFT_372604 [Cucurbitaria berberidis CBS 394.84]